MQPTVPMKVGAAFVAGIVVALGSAIIYVRSNDVRPKEAVQVAPVAATTPSPAESLPAPSDQPEVKPAPAPAPVPNPAKQSTPPPVPKPRITRRPVSLAVAHPPPVEQPKDVAQAMPLPVQTPPPPMMQAAPPRAVNDGAQPLAPPQANSASDGPSQPTAHTITLAAGTEISIRLAERISTDHNYDGDTFRATLDKPIVMEGYVIAERGSKVLGRVAKAQKSGKFSGVSELSVRLTEINTTDGQRVAIETNESLRKGPSNTNQEVAKMGGGAALGAIIGAIAGGGKGAAIGAGAGGAAGTGAVLLGHGKPAVIDNESRLSFQLSSPTTITEKLN